MVGETNGGRERAFEALRESEELHRATLSSISDAVFLCDDTGAFTFVCPNVDVIFGYEPDEVHAMGRIQRLLGDNLFDPSELAARGEIRNLAREVLAKSGERRSLRGGSGPRVGRQTDRHPAPPAAAAARRADLQPELVLQAPRRPSDLVVRDPQQLGQARIADLFPGVLREMIGDADVDFERYLAKQRAHVAFIVDAVTASAPTSAPAPKAARPPARNRGPARAARG